MEVDENKVYTWANSAGYKFFGQDVIGKEAAGYFEGEQDTYHEVQPLFAGEEDVVYVENWQRRIDGEKRLLAWWCRVLKDSNGRVTGALSTARDITDQKRAKDALLASKADLEIQKLALEEKNIALHEVLEHIASEKEKIKKDVQANVEKLLLPTLEKIKIQGNSADNRYLDMLRQDLESLTTSFGSKITAREVKLAPREIEICHHIRSGHTNKEIADLLSIDIRTVETHRNRIRKKLGISHTNINLTTYLQSLGRPVDLF